MADSNLHPVFQEILDSQLSIHSVSSSSSDEPESCPAHSVSNRRELYFAFMKEYNSLMGESEHQILKEEVEVLLANKIVGNKMHRYYAWLGESGSLSFGRLCLPGRPATTEEAQPLFDALKKAGKRWNAETMEVEEIPESTRIREWMDMNIKCGGEVVDIAEVIERYLKYREGEK